MSERTCKGCGGSLAGRDPRASWCKSDECERARINAITTKRNAKRLAKQQAARAERKCEGCGGSLNHRPPQAKWCGIGRCSRWSTKAKATKPGALPKGIVSPKAGPKPKPKRPDRRFDGITMGTTLSDRATDVAASWRERRSQAAPTG